MAALSKPLAQTAQPSRVRRGLPIAAMTLRENKIAIYSVIGCIIMLLTLITMVGGTSDTIAFLSDITPLKYAPLSNVLLFHELTWWHPALLVAIGVVSGVAGLVVFRRRDIAC